MSGSPDDVRIENPKGQETVAERQIEKITLERNAAKSSTRDERGKNDDDNRPASKADYVDFGSDREKEKALWSLRPLT